LADFDLSMAITAEGGDEAAAEIGKAEAAGEGLVENQRELEAQSRKTGQSAAEMAKQFKTNADAMNAVTRATNPVVGSQRALDQAMRKVERAYLDGKVSAELFAKAQEVASRASFATATSARQAQAGTRQLGLQFNDLGTQIAAGISPMTAFIQQSGQVGYAMSQMGGTAGKVGSFLAGGWGALILVGASVLANFISKLTDAKKKTEELGDAQKIHAMTVDELTKAIDANVQALEKSNRTASESLQHELDLAAAHRRRAADLRQETVDLLNNAVAEERAANARRLSAIGPGQTEMAQGQQFAAQSQINVLQAELTKANLALNKANQEVVLAAVPIARANAKAATDKSAKITQDYEKAVTAATKEFTDHGHDINKLNTALQAAERAQTEANKKLQESNRKPRTVSLGDQVTATTGRGIFEAAAGHLGQNERTPTLQSFLSGQHIDPEKEAWCAAFVNAVLGSQGIKGSGSNLARSFLGYGSATNTPEKGDIVVLKSKASASGTHVGIFDSAAGGRVNVLGGNQGGGRVKVSSFAQSDVLGFRRAPTASDSFAEEEKLAKKASDDAEKLAEFGKRAAEQIGALGNKALSGGTLQQATQQAHQLDVIMQEVEKNKPKNLDELRASAAAARKEIKDGILQPFNDYIAAQKQSLQVDQLRAAGLTAEADTLQEVYRQEKAIGEDLLPEQVRQIYEGVKAREALAKVTKEDLKTQQEYLKDIGEYKDVFRTLFSGKKSDVLAFPKKLLETVQGQASDKLFDQVFGGVFKKLEDDATGANKVKAANVKLANSGDHAADAVLKLARAAETAAGAVAGQTPDSQAGQIADGIANSPVGESLDKLTNKGVAIKPSSLAGLGDIFKSLFSEKGAILGGNILESMFGGVGQQKGKVTGGGISDILGSLGQTAAQFMPQLGVAMGVTSAISKVLKLPNFAGGSFGIVGNLIAKLAGFGKRVVPKGGVSLGDVYGTPTQGGDSNLSSQFVGVGSNIQSSLQNIAQQLGGAIGAFQVAIGTFDGDIRVNTDGKVAGKSLNRKTPGTTDFNQDMEAAVRFAIMDAIKDGAITGLSAAVQKAIQSNPDLDRALQEALKVQNLESLLKGVGGTLDQAFRSFEVQAKDRVRIAKTYGLDLVKTEELNAKERVKVFDDVLQSRIGDLKGLLDSMKFGDLAEGTLADQRKALLAQISTVRAQADQGVDGAASQLAGLESSLLGKSRAGFGTAGPEYAADRAAAEADAQRIIAEETARAREAQQQAIDSLNAATTQNNLTNETNGLIAVSNNYLGTIAGALTAGAAVGGGGSQAGGADRYTRLTARV
jgi:uncharacterized protein (TIGR02594 family)